MRHARDRGFTLVELLVVMIILGVLSGVVVFALRGTGDKGEQAASETDKRIVRTAMETFCARYGRYAEDMDELVHGPRDGAGGRVGKGFLSEASTYNADFELTSGGVNACGGTSYRFIDGGPDECARLNDKGEEEIVPALSGMWCLADGPRSFVDDAPTEFSFAEDKKTIWRSGWENKPNVVQLLDGRVLAIGFAVTGLPPQKVLGTDTTGGVETELFDPKDGPRGKWSPGPVARLRENNPPFYGDGDGNFQGAVVIGGTAGQCGERCGQVFANFQTHSKLYDPHTNTWKVIEPNPPVGRGHAGITQLLGPGCAPHCGKILLAHQVDKLVQLYDPKLNIFEPPFAFATDNYSSWDPMPTELADGRVVVRVHAAGSWNRVYLLDPELRISQPIRDTTYAMKIAPPIVLPGEAGRVLYMQNGWQGEIYTPDPGGGPGVWAVLTRQGSPNEAGHTCDTDGSNFCNSRTKVPDGQVLVHRRGDVTDFSATGNTTMLFDSTVADVTKQWSDTRFPLNDTRTWGFAVLIKGTFAQCATNCNKVLMVGPWGRAELYKP